MNQASEDANRARMSFAAILGLKLIRFYQKYISPWLGANCRFQPTCSQYTFEAVEKYGFLKGCWMGFWRIMRCNPFSRGGNDPVK